MSSVIDRLIFFEYYDGIKSKGMRGFDPMLPVGSVKHKRSLNLLNDLTPDKFRSKARKLALLAKEFIKASSVPGDAYRVALHDEKVQENIIEEARPPIDTRTLEEKFGEIESDTERFIFYRYFEGLVTSGEFGFPPKYGPPGCVYHKRTYSAAFQDLTDAQFRDVGRRMGELAQEFFNEKVVPPAEEAIANTHANPPPGLTQAANGAGFFM